PLPPGSRLASADEAARITVASYSSSDNRVDRHATYVVPMSMDEVVAWYRAHAPAGTVQDGESSGNDPVLSKGLGFDARRRSPAYVGLEADINTQAEGDGALLRIDAQAEWLADASPARVPDSVTSVQVVQVTDSGAVHRGRLTGVPMH